MRFINVYERLLRLPELSRFHGIVIRMFHDEHDQPHFHAVYGRDNAAIGINTLEVLAGNLPRREMSLVIRWAKLHQGELSDAWNRIQQDQPPGKITPLP